MCRAHFRGIMECEVQETKNAIRITLIARATSAIKQARNYKPVRGRGPRATTKTSPKAHGIRICGAYGFHEASVFFFSSDPMAPWPREQRLQHFIDEDPDKHPIKHYSRNLSLNSGAFFESQCCDFSSDGLSALCLVEASFTSTMSTSSSTSQSSTNSSGVP